MEAKYAYIIVDLIHEKVDRPFLYEIPSFLLGKLKEGDCVNVPFGNGNKCLKGYVIGFTQVPDFDVNKVKKILSLSKEDLSIEGKMICLAKWMKEHYGSTMIQALKTVLPAKQKVQNQVKKHVKLLVEESRLKPLILECKEKHRGAQERVLEEFLKGEILPYERFTKTLKVSPGTLQSLEKKGILKIQEEISYRQPKLPFSYEKDETSFSQEQAEIIEKIMADLDNGTPKKYLIHGITGSGKTKVYIGLIEEVIKRGKQAIVLIPEIALTYQTVMRFYEHFKDRVSILNSSLSKGEKYDQCQRAKHGEIDVMIGPRSALFTPFPNLGMVIIDEEHENSYKSESTPKYHARETAEELVRLHGGALVLGSATPSLEAYYGSQRGDYQLFTLKKRLTGGSLPKVYIVDLREELRSGNRSIFSIPLQELMKQRLEKKEQIMLFLNRRGYAGFVSCRACGHVMKCPHCDVSLSEHKNGKLICHYCGYEEAKVSLCPNCGSKYISGFRAGTQQIEEKIKLMFPQARVLRMDADTTRKKGSYGEILHAFFNQEADILIGTQMIVKGHDFPNVTLVGILAADLSLSVSDYRCGEKTFQLLTQAAGRAGRGEKPGEVVIQTYQPEHYSITYAKEQDYEGFYEEEMLYRKMLHYPPSFHMLGVQIFAREEELGEKLSTQLFQEIAPYCKEKKAQILGPSKGVLEKVQDIYRYVFYVKSEKYDTLIETKNILEKRIETLPKKNEMVQFDFDPINMF